MDIKLPRRAPAVERNREPILAVLTRVLTDETLLLEVASGTGEHAAYLTPHLPAIVWQPSDANAENLIDIDAHTAASLCPRILPALFLDVSNTTWPAARADAVFCCNLFQVAPREAAAGLFAGAARTLAPGRLLITYGPYKRHGAHISASNETFDASVRQKNPQWGVRCADTEIAPMAASHGFALAEIVDMPANNLMLIFRRL